MRSYRLSGIVVVALIGVGVVTQRPADQSTIDPTGTNGAPEPLPSSALTAATFGVGVPHDSWRNELPRLPLTGKATQALVPVTGGLSPVPQLPPPPPPVPVPAPSVAPPVVVPAVQAAAAVPAPAPVAAPAPVVTSVSSGPAPASGTTWAELRQCESGDNYAADTGNGYYGAYQFSASTWHDLGYGGLPSQASASTQDAAAQQLYDAKGWSPWPACSASLGLG